MSEVLTHTETFQQKKEESKETSQEDTCEGLFEGRGIVSAKIPKPDEVSVLGGSTKDTVAISRRELGDEFTGHRETGDHRGL